MHDEVWCFELRQFSTQQQQQQQQQYQCHYEHGDITLSIYSLLSRAEAERYWLGITMGLGSRRPAHLPPACGLRSAEATPTTTTTRPPHSLCRHLSSLHHTLRPPWWRYLPRHFRQDGKYEWSEDRNRNTLMEKFLKFHFRGDYFCFIIKLFKCQREFINKSLWKIWICEY